MTENADTRTVNGIFFAISILICEGLIWLCENLRGAFIIEIAVYLICFSAFWNYYKISFNSEVYNSTDFENGTVIDGDDF